MVICKGAHFQQHICACMLIFSLQATRQNFMCSICHIICSLPISLSHCCVYSFHSSLAVFEHSSVGRYFLVTLIDMDFDKMQDTHPPESPTAKIVAHQGLG